VAQSNQLGYRIESYCCNLTAVARKHRSPQMPLTAPREEGVLHGDLHHDNVLDFGRRGWLAIDPHGLFGERGFDYANNSPTPTLAIPVGLSQRS
jgi:streptomycin 6-kinase